MKKFIKTMLCTAVTVLFSACYHISYDGKADPPLPAGIPVTVFMSKSQLPPRYTVLGTATATAGVTWTTQELESKLIEFAREKGANGVYIVDIDKIPAGKARPDQIDNTKSVNWTVDDDSQSSFSYFHEYMLNYGDKNKKEKEVYDLKIKAELILIK